MPHANWRALNKIFLDVLTVANHSLIKFSILQFLNKNIHSNVNVFWSNDFFFYLGFYLPTFTIHRAAGKAEGYFFSSSLPLTYLDNSREITAESSLLQLASSRTQIGNFGFLAQVANHGTHDYMYDISLPYSIKKSHKLMQM